MMMNGDQPKSGGSSDPGSFIVLPNPNSLGNQNGAAAGFGGGQLHGPRSIAELQASISQSDISLEDAMSKVWDLMRENQDLKETVKGHTELMKKQFNVMADLKEKWNGEQEEMKIRHQQAKDVVLGLRESIKEKDDIIAELKVQLNGQNSGTEASVKVTAPNAGATSTDGHQRKLQELESDNQLLLQSKVDLGKQVQDLTDELIELRERYASRTEPEEVIINIGKETASMQAHLISMENKHNADQVQQQYQRKIDVLSEEVQKHIQTIENLTQELSLAKSVKEEIENEYIKLSEEHCMLQGALKEDTDMLKDSHSSVKKIQESYQKLMKEKQELLAINNQLTLQIQSLKGSPLSDKSIESMMSPVDETTTSNVLFTRDQYIKQLEKRKKQEAQEVAFDTGVIVGELASPIDGFTTVTLSGPVDKFINQINDNTDAEPISKEMKQAESLQATADQSPGKKKSREDQAVSDLLLQLQEERSKVTDMMSKLKAQSTQIAELTIKLKDKEHHLALTTKSASKLSEERNDEREQLLNRIELLKEELFRVQDEQDEPLQSIGEVQTLQVQIVGLITDLKDCEDKYYAAEKAIGTHKERCIDLQAKVEMYQDEIEVQRAKDDQLIDAMRTTITALEAQLSTERQEIQMKSRAMQDLRTSHDQICADYHELINEMEGNKDTKASSAQVESLRREYQSTVDNLTAKLITTEEALMTQREEFMQMRGKWKEMKSELETVPVLKAQAEVFKVDFEAERKAREEMASERDRLKEGFEQVQLRNQQLLDEMQAMSATQVSELQRRHGYMVITEPANIGARIHLDPNQVGPSPRQLLQMRDKVQQQQHHQPPDLIEEGGAGEAGLVAGERDNRERSPFDIQRNVAAIAANARQAEELEEHEGFRCPKCDIACPDYDTLNLHVNECLDQD